MTIDFTAPSQTRILYSILGYCGYIEQSRWELARYYICALFKSAIPHITYEGRKGVHYPLPAAGAPAWHHVAYMSPLLNDPAEATYIFLADNHNSSACRIHNAMCMDSLIQPGSILLVECVTALTAPSTGPLICKNYRLSPYGTSLLRLVGWDYFNTMSIPPEGIAEAVARGADPSGQYAPLFARGATGDETIRSYFPQRTQSMVDTIGTCEKMRMRGELLGKVFCIAGLRHFIEDGSDARYSLKKFYEQIHGLPAVIVYPADTST